MFAVEGWKLPNIVPQRPEKKRKAAPDSTAASKPKKQKTATKAVSKTNELKKPGKDKSKYTPYGKTKGSTGSNVVPVAKERKARPKSPSPIAQPAKTHAQPGKRKDKKPLARPPRAERSATPEKLGLAAAPPPPPFTGLSSPSASVHLTPLQRKMAAKLSGARFRWINERLYTTTGQAALALIQERPEMFREYHAGFAAQVLDWPSNPVDTFIARLEQRVATSRAQTQGKKKKGRKQVVLDLGCGEGELGRRVRLVDEGEEYVQVLSYDLQAANPHIIACDMSSLPLANGSVDVAIFCLSLMGTDFVKFLVEAFRVLRQGGELWVAEIKSRFSDPDAKNFIDALNKIGFQLTSKDESNKMFIKLDFTRGKDKRQAAGAEALAQIDTKKVGALLKPCTYKKR